MGQFAATGEAAAGMTLRSQRSESVNPPPIAQKNRPGQSNEGAKVNRTSSPLLATRSIVCAFGHSQLIRHHNTAALSDWMRMLHTIIISMACTRYVWSALRSPAGRVPDSGVGAVGKWPAGATAKSLA